MGHAYIETVTDRLTTYSACVCKKSGPHEYCITDLEILDAALCEK